MDDFFLLSARSNSGNGSRRLESSRFVRCLNTSAPLRSSHLVTLDGRPRPREEQEELGASE